ncbi:MAG: hypothetical protein PHP88_12650 [bacterium]|nr:hypothetical protein [bacterium]
MIRDSNGQSAPMKNLLVAAFVLLLMAGCAPNSQFVYKPGPPEPGGAKLPVKIAVLPFKDGTEDFTKRGRIAQKNLTYNLAKTGIGSTGAPLTPELWAKAFADDLTASGAFREVRFLYSTSELTDEEFYIEGTLEKAYIVRTAGNPNEFALGLRALRKMDHRLIWEKEVTGGWNHSRRLSEVCRAVGVHAAQCNANAVINRIMQRMFEEARADFMAMLGSASKGREGRDAVGGGTSTPRDTESTEQTIDRILREK